MRSLLWLNWYVPLITLRLAYIYHWILYSSGLFNRSSSATAAVAFAVATAGSGNPPDYVKAPPSLASTKNAQLPTASCPKNMCQQNLGAAAAPLKRTSLLNAGARHNCSCQSSVSTMRVMLVLRHWVTKHSQVLRPRSKRFFISVKQKKRS